MALLGGALLWFGWFGFNAGSALAANGIAANAFMTTNTAAAAGAVAWLLVSWLYGRPASIGMITGAVAGLVAITPAAGYVSVPASILIGGVAGVLCYGAMVWRLRRTYDESLDAFAVHGVGGLWGTIATGVFATVAVNLYPGLIEGNAQQLLVNTVVGARDHGLRVRRDLRARLAGGPPHRPPGQRGGGVRRASTSPSTASGSPTSNLFPCRP